MISIDLASSMSPSWFSDAVARKVGDGSQILFWLDSWLGDTRLKDVFPRLYQVSLDQKATISGFGEWSSVGWHWCWRWRRSLFVWEEEILTELQNLLSLVVLQQQSSDSWNWKPDNFNSFSSLLSIFFNQKSSHPLMIQ